MEVKVPSVRLPVAGVTPAAPPVLNEPATSVTGIAPPVPVENFTVPAFASVTELPAAMAVFVFAASGVTTPLAEVIVPATVELMRSLPGVPPGKSTVVPAASASALVPLVFSVTALSRPLTEPVAPVALVVKLVPGCKLTGIGPPAPPAAKASVPAPVSVTVLPAAIAVAVPAASVVTVPLAEVIVPASVEVILSLPGVPDGNSTLPPVPGRTRLLLPLVPSVKFSAVAVAVLMTSAPGTMLTTGTSPALLAKRVALIPAVLPAKSVPLSLMLPCTFTPLLRNTPPAGWLVPVPVIVPPVSVRSKIW